jgi:hypothetical protein
LEVLDLVWFWRFLIASFGLLAKVNRICLEVRGKWWLARKFFYTSEKIGWPPRKEGLGEKVVVGKGEKRWKGKEGHQQLSYTR